MVRAASSNKDLPAAGLVPVPRYLKDVSGGGEKNGGRRQRRALDSGQGGLLEARAASNGLGPNVGALKMELLYARAMRDNAQEREIRSPALKELLAYDADDVLDELEYFRIQDELDGTYLAADVHAGDASADSPLTPATRPEP
jgi:hypothetical protein